MTQKNDTTNSATSHDTEPFQDDPTPPKKSLPLSNCEQLRQEMARVYRQTRNGDINASVGTKLIYMLTAILRAIESGVLEQRINDMEAAVRRRGK